MNVARKSAMPGWWLKRTAKPEPCVDRRIALSSHATNIMLGIITVLLGYLSLSSSNAFQEWQQIESKAEASLHKEEELAQAARWQKEHCLQIASVAASFATVQPDKDKQEIYAAAASIDPACGNVSELAAFFQGSKRTLVEAGGQRVKAMAREADVPKVELTDRFFLGRPTLPGFDVGILGHYVERNPINSPTAAESATSEGFSSLEKFVVESGVRKQNSARVQVGTGINWNSPFGPFRIDVARTLREEYGRTEPFVYDVATQF